MTRRAAAQGLHLLLETPPATEPAAAAELMSFVTAQDVAVEVAEQNPRGPDAAFALAVIASGALGDVRMVTCDLASYRYHATAVGRALLGRPRGGRATALRAVFPGLPAQAAAVVAGTIEAHGKVLQVRDGEGLYAASAPWLSGGWTMYGSTGSLLRGEVLRISGEDHPVVHDVAEVGGVTFRRGVQAAGIEWSADWPTAALDDDGRAIARCVTDWLARVDGRVTATQWSLEDAVTDLRWIAALERSAVLGGAPILL